MTLASSSRLASTPTQAELALREHVKSTLEKGTGDAFFLLSGGTGQISEVEFEAIVEAAIHSKIVNASVAICSFLPFADPAAAALMRTTVSETAQRLSFTLPLTCERLFNVFDLDGHGAIDPGEFAKAQKAIAAGGHMLWARVLNGNKPRAIMPSTATPVLEEWMGACRCSLLLYAHCCGISVVILSFFSLAAASSHTCVCVGCC